MKSKDNSSPAFQSMTELHYWSLHHTITGWGALILAMNLDGTWRFSAVLIVAAVSFVASLLCMIKIEKGAAK